MMEIIELTEAEFDEIMYSVSTFSVFIGIIIGMCLAAIFIYLNVSVSRKNFKMYLLQLNDTEKQLIERDVNQLHITLEDLSKTNTRYFKKLYNELCELKSYLSQKWMQN